MALLFGKAGFAAFAALQQISAIYPRSYFALL
jgi:hypothetical protein